MNGIGGRTITEAQRRLSYREFLTWMKYRRKRGSMNFGMRIERGTAMLATLYANSKSRHGGYTIFDFMPHAEEAAISLEDAMESWS